MQLTHVRVRYLSLTAVNTRGSRPTRPIAYPTRVVAVELAANPSLIPFHGTALG
jgi:hypothetical protein